MNHNFDDAQAILEELFQAIQEEKRIRDRIKKDNPGFKQLSDKHWEQQEAFYWLHGATDFHETNEIGRWLFDSPPLSDTAKSKASKCIKDWKTWLEQTDAYYGDFEDFKLEKPNKEEILYDYIYRIAELVEKEGKGARLEWRALKSFLAYMRHFIPKEVAFIEQIFPEEMDLSFGRIIRLIKPEVYPISQEIARDILFQLVQMGTKGRPNSFLTALESLGLCWLCLTASRLRLPTHLKMIQEMKASAIGMDGEYPYMLVPTFFGDRKIRISNHVAKFLIALSKIPSKKPRDTILQSPKRSLTRTFSRALQNCELNYDKGNITYVTLLSPPHHFGRNVRSNPK